jgi:hypothetical protein
LLQELKAHSERIFIAGGFIRAVVSREPVNDIDVFVASKGAAETLARVLAKNPKDIHRSENALTVKSFNPVIQIIHRWIFDSPKDVVESFDFTVCAASFFHDGDNWASVCDDRFYSDLASKRLTYRKPVRIEDAGGSALRLLKYYQRGYRVPIDSYAAILARMAVKLDLPALQHHDDVSREQIIAKVFQGLLREVDPSIDPGHISHLPAEEAEEVRNSGGAAIPRLSSENREMLANKARNIFDDIGVSVPVTTDLIHD